MTTDKIDYTTLLAHIDALGVKVYNSNHIEFKFNRSHLLGRGQCMTVYRGLLKVPETGADCCSLPVAIKIPNQKLQQETPNSKIYDVLAEVRQEIRMMKHFDAHPFIISLYGVVFLDLKPAILLNSPRPLLPNTFLKGWRRVTLLFGAQRRASALKLPTGFTLYTTPVSLTVTSKATTFFCLQTRRVPES